jgi:hypothetical protein
MAVVGGGGWVVFTLRVFYSSFSIKGSHINPDSKSSTNLINCICAESQFDYKNLMLNIVEGSMAFLFKRRHMKWSQINFSSYPQYIRVMKTTEKPGSCKYQAEHCIKCRVLLSFTRLS